MGPGKNITFDAVKNCDSLSKRTSCDLQTMSPRSKGLGHPHRDLWLQM